MKLQIANSICKFLKLNKITQLCKTFRKLVKLPYKNFFLNINRKGIYFIWVRFKSRKAELKQHNVSLAICVDRFCQDCSYNIRLIFTNTISHIFRIPRDQSIPNTPSSCLKFSFFVEGLFNLNCLHWRLGDIHV